MKLLPHGTEIKNNLIFWDPKGFKLGNENRHKKMMVFDWVGAASVIKERNPKVAQAGLQGDFKYTNGVIYQDNQIITDRPNLYYSTWVIPILILNGCEIYECFLMEDEVNYSISEVWPKEARKIMEVNNEIFN